MLAGSITAAVLLRAKDILDGPSNPIRALSRTDQVGRPGAELQGREPTVHEERHVVPPGHVLRDAREAAAAGHGILRLHRLQARQLLEIVSYARGEVDVIDRRQRCLRLRAVMTTVVVAVDVVRYQLDRPRLARRIPLPVSNGGV